MNTTTGLRALALLLVSTGAHSDPATPNANAPSAFPATNLVTPTRATTASACGPGSQYGESLSLSGLSGNKDFQLPDEPQVKDTDQPGSRTLPNWLEE